MFEYEDQPMISLGRWLNPLEEALKFITASSSAHVCVCMCVSVCVSRWGGCVSEGFPDD